MRRGDVDRARADAANASSSLGEALALLAIVALVLSIWVFLSGCGGADFDLVARIAAEEEGGVEFEIGDPPQDSDAPSSDSAPADSIDSAPDDTGPAPKADAIESEISDGASDSLAPDSAPPDSGAVDSGSFDAGPVDSGPADSGPADTGPADTGTAADVRICQEGTTAGYPPGEDCALGSLDCCTGPCVYVATMCCGRGRCM